MPAARTLIALALALAPSSSMAAARFAPAAAWAAGATPPALPATPVPLPALPLPTGARLMVVGDSLSNFNNGALAVGSGGYAYGRLSGPVETVWATDPRFNFDSWFDPADPWIGASGGVGARGLNGANQGIAGDHLDWCNPAFGGGIFQRTRYDLSRGPQIVWLNAGTNTISSGDGCGTAQPATAGYVIGRLDATIGQFTANGVWVILSTLYPRGDWPAGDARHETLRAVNRWIRTQAGRYGIAGVMDPYPALVATTDPDGVDERYFTSDKVHPGLAGGWLIGDAYLKPLIQAAIAPGRVFDENPATANLLPAATALMNGGTTGTKAGNVAGTVATGLSVTQSRDGSTVAAALEDAGSYRRQVLTIAPAGSGTSYGQIDLGMPSLSGAALPPGESWVRGYVHVETADALSIAHLRMTIECRSSSEATMTVTANLESSGAFAIAAPGRGGYWIATKPFRLPPNPTLIAPRVSLFWPSAGYPAGTMLTVKLDRPILRTTADPRPAWNLP